MSLAETADEGSAVDDYPYPNPCDGDDGDDRGSEEGDCVPEPSSPTPSEADHRRRVALLTPARKA